MKAKLSDKYLGSIFRSESFLSDNEHAVALGGLKLNYEMVTGMNRLHVPTVSVADGTQDGAGVTEGDPNRRKY